MKNLLFLMAALALLANVSSCAKAKSVNQYTDAVTCNEADDNLNTYSGKIATILNGNCANAGCHNAVSHQSGRDYSSYVAAKSAFNSNALCTINHDNGCQAMPQGTAKMSSADIHDLTCWVKNDYPQ